MKKRILKLIILFVGLCILLSSKVQALTSAELGQYIGQYAVDYYNEYGERVMYSVNAQHLRPACYRLEEFTMDCAGFATLVWLNSNDVQLHRAELSNNGSIAICNGYWKGSVDATTWADIFDMVEDGSLVPGDLVIMSTNGEGLSACHHVGVYAGQYGVVHCNGGITASPLDGRRLTNANYVIEGTFRVKESVAANAHGKTFSPNSSIGGLDGGTIGDLVNALKNWTYQKVPFRKVTESSVDKNKTFSYQGIAKSSSQTTINNNIQKGKSLGIFEVTAYCNCEICTGKNPGDAGYGITASGETATANRTIATDWSVIPKNTHVIINGKEYIAEDTRRGYKGK